MKKDRSKRKFVYKKRTSDQVEKRESGAMFDSPFKGKFKTFVPKEGDYCVRILPAQHKDAEHYGVDIYTHYGVGAENNRYLCHKKMASLAPDDQCAVCEEWEKAKRDDDEEYSKKLRANRQILVWVIDRDHEKSGPQLWCMPGGVDVEIAKRSHNKRTGETLLPEDPDEGSDITFSRNGKGLNVKYTAVTLEKSTPLSDDEDKQADWLQFVAENPLDEVLNFFDADYIAKVFGGGKSKADEDDDEEDDKPRTRRSAREEDEDDEDEDDKPRKRKQVIEDDDEELDEDEDEAEEDEAPRKRRPSRDDDQEDEEEEEEERPRKKKRVVEDDEDEEEDVPNQKRFPIQYGKWDKRSEQEEEDEEDEEDRPRKKKGNLKDKIREGMRRK